MVSVLSRSCAVTAAVLKELCALVNVSVSFPFSGDLLLPITGVDVVGKFLKKEIRERRSLISSLL